MKVHFVLRHMCVMLWLVHMGSAWPRVGCINPTLHLATAAFYSLSPSGLSSFALSDWKQSTVYSQGQEQTRANREWLDLSKADWTLIFHKGKKLRPVYSWSSVEWLYTELRGAYRLTWVHPDRLRWKRLWQPFPVVRYINPLSVNL